ncbi:MAG: glycosyltransferase family 4 protein [Candidatus Yonathbacteria bacterium]|nr:glycosyltransferase family 4 protein [Candidatus Yonathbacteria bacterium]NTW47943.1 glycosyltransferase family 4 protein [Candidatus Yonathbacteria bacterium]
MNILWIISSGWKEGGAENYIVTLKPFLEHMGHTVKILASDDRPDQPHFSDYTFKTYRGIFRVFAHVWNIDARRVLKKVLKEFKPDIVHIHTIGHASPAILLALHAHPTAYTMHGPEAFIKTLLHWCFPSSYFTEGHAYEKEYLRLTGKLRVLYHRFLTDPLYAIGLRHVDTIISPSAFMRDIVAKQGLPSVVIPNGISLLPYHAPHQSRMNNTVVYVGRLEKYKGVDYLLQAFSEVLIHVPQAQLIIAGDGSMRKDLEQEAQALGITNNVTFLGRISREALINIYTQASCVVIPSIWFETFGMVGLEAMSIGRPVIVSDVGGISEWFSDGETGYAVPPKDSHAIASAIVRLFEHPETAIVMGEKGRARAEHFGMKEHAQEIIRLYENMVTQGNMFPETKREHASKNA